MGNTLNSNSGDPVSKNLESEVKLTALITLSWTYPDASKSLYLKFTIFAIPSTHPKPKNIPSLLKDELAAASLCIFIVFFYCISFSSNYLS